MVENVMALISRLSRTHVYRNVEAVCNHLHCDAKQTVQASSLSCSQHSPASSLSTETLSLESPPELSTPPFDYRTIHVPQNCQKVPCRHQSHCAIELEQVSTLAHPDFPVCQRHHVFLSTRVHDHIQQVTRFVRREIGVVANRQSVQRKSRNITD